MPVPFADLLLAFEFVSTAGLGEHQAVVDRESGKIYFQSDVLAGDPEEEWPADVDDEKYVEIPHKHELDLGKALVFDFVSEVLPGEYEEVRRIFSRRGAYGRFKSLLVQRGALDRWYDFSNQAEEAALRAWCVDNAIEVSD